jgi:chemotaxis protein methyltransferase CheR
MKIEAMHPLIHDPAFGKLKEYLIESTGLAYYSDKDTDLAARVSNRLALLKLDGCGSYLSLLKDDERGAGERQELIGQLTIGETFFFRHSEQIDAIRDVVLPDVIERNKHTRTLRIWSAGCSIGAEPYSLAILLKTSFADQLAGWDIRILGTDINQSFMARAARGEFDENALRTSSEAFRDQWFSRQGRFLQIHTSAKEWVTFQQHNLVEHPYPSHVHGITALDLIICRNVMIYFDWDRIRKIVAQFHECLVPGGWLAVGHAEFNADVFADYRTVNVPGATLYQKTGEKSSQGFSALSQSSPGARGLSEWPSPSAEVWAPVLPEVPIFRPLPPPVPPPLPEGLALIRQLADAGNWGEAARRCEDALRQDDLNPALHFHHALILEQMGRHADSERALRRTIYLDRSFALAHYHLALLQKRSGNSIGAVQSLNNTRNLVSRLRASERIAEGDGITADELVQLAELQLESLNR